MLKIPYIPLTIIAQFGIMTYPDMKANQQRKKLRNEIEKSIVKSETRPIFSKNIRTS